MKSATEKRLLFALLLSSLVPLAFLGLGASAAVHKLRLEVTKKGKEAALERARDQLLARCFEASSAVSAYFVGARTDLGTLAATAPTAQAYLEVCQNPRSPGTKGGRTRGGRGRYEELAFFGPDGRQLVRVRGGAALGPRDFIAISNSGPAALVWRECFVRTQALRGGEISLTPWSLARGSELERAQRTKTIVLGTPVYASGGRFQGIAAAALGAEPLHKLLLTFLGARGSSPRLEDTRGVLFDQRGAVFCAAPAGASSHGPEEALLGSTSKVGADLRSGRSGVLQRDADGGAVLLVAYSPIFAEHEPSKRPTVLGGVGLLRRVEREAVPPSDFSAMAEALARRAEIESIALTLLCAAWVGFAGFIVARRMARPWIRLREKVSLSAPGLPPTSPRADDVEAISRSFDALASDVAEHAGRLRATEERLREFIEMCPDGIAVLDEAGRLVLTNRALCQMLRRSPTELVDLELKRVCPHPDDIDEMLRRAAEKGRLKDYEVELQRGDGSLFPVVFTLRSARYGGSACIEAIARDVSAMNDAHRRDREKTEELFRVHGELSRAHDALRGAFGQVEEQVRLKTSELRSAYEALQTSDRVKTDFLMKMSHELRTPLNCIIGYSEAMTEGLDGPVTDEQARSLGRIAQSGRRLLRMIEDLLDLSRLESGGMEFLCSEVRFDELLEEVLHEMRSLVAERELELQVSVREPLPLAWADPDRLRQILFNLLGNAFKFTERGHVRVEAGRGKGAFLEVRVRDTGPGVPPGQLETIFERFVQIPGRNRSGAGLGLPICRELVERMGGRIWVESEPGKGSVFAFTLPVAATRSQLPLPFEEQAGSSHLGSSPPSS